MQLGSKKPPPKAPLKGSEVKHVLGPQRKASEVRLVMCEPKYLSTAIPNNVFMEGKDKEPVDKDRALKQYAWAKHLIEALGVEVLEIPPQKGAQDQTFTANIGIAIKPYIIVANYKAPGRAIEVAPARKFFQGLGYKVIQPPFHFEGEADLKKFSDDTYIGGYGKFTDIRAHHWIEEQTGVKIVPVKEISDKLYHLDCSLMPFPDSKAVVVSRDGVDAAGIKALEKIAHLELVPKGMASVGVTNGVRIESKKVYLSGTLQPEDASYRKGIEWLLKTFDKFGYIVTFLDTDSFNPSGADLSCMTMRLDFQPKKGAVT